MAYITSYVLLLSPSTMLICPFESMMHYKGNICPSFSYVWAGMIVLFGIGVNIYEKNKSKINWMLLNMCGSCIIKISDLFNSPKKKVFDV